MAKVWFLKGSFCVRFTQRVHCRNVLAIKYCATVALNHATPGATSSFSPLSTTRQSCFFFMFLDRTVFIRKGRRARRKTVSTYANRETVSHLRTAELLSVISIREFTWNAQQVSARRTVVSSVTYHWTSGISCWLYRLHFGSTPTG